MSTHCYCTQVHRPYLSVNPSSFAFLGKPCHRCQIGSNVNLRKKLHISQSGQRSFNLIICPIQLQFEGSRGPKVRQGGLQALVAKTAQPLIIVNRGRHLSILPLVPGRSEIILLALSSLNSTLSIPEKKNFCVSHSRLLHNSFLHAQTFRHFFCSWFPSCC